MSPLHEGSSLHTMWFYPFLHFMLRCSHVLIIHLEYKVRSERLWRQPLGTARNLLTTFPSFFTRLMSFPFDKHSKKGNLRQTESLSDLTLSSYPRSFLFFTTVIVSCPFYSLFIHQPPPPPFLLLHDALLLPFSHKRAKYKRHFAAVKSVSDMSERYYS